MIKCMVCGQPTIMQVASNNALDFFSCCNENCKEYGELLVETNGGLIGVVDMLESYREIVNEITDEKNRLPRS